MKLVSYGKKGEERCGYLLGDKILDLNLASMEFNAENPLPVKMMDLFWLEDWFERVQDILNKIHTLGNPGFKNLHEIRLGPPILTPSKIIAIGANYEEHVSEAVKDIKLPESPILFSKAPSAANGPYDDIIYPPETQALDYEVELGVVIGKMANRVEEEKAYDYVAGFMVCNDISARDIQRSAKFGNRDSQWFRGKSFDTFAPMGPYLVTKDEIPHPHNLRISLTLNGVIKQDSNTGKMIFKIPQIISFITKGITLFPGDVIFTGTPSGVGIFSDPPSLLKPGDIIISEIEGLGTMRNKIVVSIQ